MKKFIFSSFVFALVFNTFGQDAADKKVQAGLVFGYGLNFQKMGTKLMQKDGAGGDLTIGANVIFGVNDNNNLAFCTGLEFDFSHMGFKPANYNTYYNFNDTDISQKGEPGASDQLYRLESRTQKAVYLTLPTMFQFRTNFIGYFRYFGKFGLRNSFLLSSKTNDEGAYYNSTQASWIPSSNDAMKSPGSMWIYKGAVGLSGGAEWNFVGSTCLMLEIGYYYGFTPLYTNRKDDKRTLFTSVTPTDPNSRSYFNNKVTQSQLMMKLSILF